MNSTLTNHTSEIDTFKQTDGYISHFRRWGPPQGEDVLVILHGGISHAGWQAPLAEALVERAGLTVTALDRRGSGLNAEQRGHLISEGREVEDIASFLRALKASYARVHLAGWCFGGQVASIVAAHLVNEHLLNSLTLIAPGFVFTERYSDVLRLSTQAVLQVIEGLELTPARDHAFVPVPLQTSDFTHDADWLQFVENDPLRLSRVTLSTVDVWNDLANRSRSGVLSQLGSLPVLAIFGEQDRLVNNGAAQELLRQQLRGSAPVIEVLDASHAIQFEQPSQLAALVAQFIEQNR